MIFFFFFFFFEFSLISLYSLYTNTVDILWYHNHNDYQSDCYKEKIARKTICMVFNKIFNNDCYFFKLSKKNFLALWLAITIFSKFQNKITVAFS